MNYESKKLKFSSYSNGLTPHVGENGNWFIGDDDSGILARGTDGVSFEGVTEWYYATLATNIDASGEPNRPTTVNKDGSPQKGWKNSISETGFGTKNANKVTYKYLWNIEEIKSTYKNKSNQKIEQSVYTELDLMDIYSEGRVPVEYISYYAADTDNTAPDKWPVLKKDGNSFEDLEEDSLWTTEFNGTADANNFLYEITFVKYADYDENGQNLYAKLAGPTLIGRNSAGVILSLSNDYDTVSRNSLGKIISELPITIKAQVLEGDSVKVLEDKKIGVSAPSNDWQGYYTYDQNNSTLKITGIPSSFTSGTFKFSWNGFEKDFSLNVIPSEVDYDLIVSPTSIDSSEAGSITVTVKRTDVDGSVTIYGPTDDSNIELYQGPSKIEGEWIFSYSKGNLIPMEFTIKSGNTIWDKEVVEFHRDTGMKRLDMSLITKTKQEWLDLAEQMSCTLDVDTTGEQNKKICKSDVVYLDGLVKDVFTSTGSDAYQSVKLFGTVSNILNTSIALDSLRLEWGASIGETGAPATHMELDNDSDVITIVNGNTLNLPTITANIYYGDTILDTTSESGIGNWSITPPSDKWNDDNYTKNKNQLIIKKIPDDFTSGDFTFTWNSNTGNLISKKFSLATVASDNDWNLIIDKAVINKDGSSKERTINIKVQKITSSGSEYYALNNLPKDSSGDDLVYVVNSENGTYVDKITSSNRTLTNASTYYLKQNKEDGAIPANFQWDVESVGAVSNGASAYHLELDNDNDVVSVANGKAIGMPIEVNAQGYAGISAKDDGSYDWSIPEGWESSCSYEKGSKTLKINSVPKDKTSATFSCTWTVSGAEYKKTFNLTTVNASVDYDLVITPPTINLDRKDKTVTIQIKETDSAGTRFYTLEKNSKLPQHLAIYKDGGSDPLTDVQTISEETTFTLKQTKTIGSISAGFTWDSEVVGVVHDGNDSVSYWLACDASIIAKAADGTYKTKQVTFTPMMQTGSSKPKICDSNSDVKLAFWKDEDSNKTTGEYEGQQIVYLVEPKDYVDEIYLKVENTLYGRMFVNDVMVSEQKIEVQRDGVTVTEIRYGVSMNYSEEPEKWDVNYPNNISPGSWIWTKTTYSNNQVAYSKTYYSQDNITLSLTNDYDLIVKNNAGILVSTQMPTSEMRLYQGQNEINNGISYKWTGPGKFSSTVKILDLSKDYSTYGPGNYVATATYNKVDYTKTFKVEETTAEVDYDLIVPTSVNVTSGAQQVSVKVLKTGKGYSTDSNDTQTLTSAGSHPIKIWYQKKDANGNWSTESELSTWSSLSVSTDTKIILKSSETNSTLVWDEEIIEALKNGQNGGSLQVRYKNASSAPSTPTSADISTWSTSIPTPETGKKTYMTQKLSTETTWSTPIQISAEDGTTPTVTIDGNGYWVINGKTSTTKAQGPQGNTPKMTVGKNGNWYADGVDTGVKAQGEAGKDGSDIEYVYYRCAGTTSSPAPTTAPSYTESTLTIGWSKSPTGITIDYPYEYISVRTKAAGSNTWSSFSTPVIWSKWGDKGQDGDGVYYYYCRINSTTAPQYPKPDGADYNWTDEPSGVDENYKYEYVVAIRTDETTPPSADNPRTGVLWANYSVDGVGTKGDTSGTITVYQATEGGTAPATPSSGSDLGDWSETQPEASSTNKFIWKTNGTFKQSSEDNTVTYGTSWTTPELYSAWYADGISGPQVAEYYKLFGTDATKQGMKYDPSGNLYINASMINTGLFSVKDGDDVAFSAGWTENADGSKDASVSLAGWSVTKDSITKGSNSTLSGIYSSGLSMHTPTDNASSTREQIRFLSGIQEKTGSNTYTLNRSETKNVILGQYISIKAYYVVYSDSSTYTVDDPEETEFLRKAPSTAIFQVTKTGNGVQIQNITTSKQTATISIKYTIPIFAVSENGTVFGSKCYFDGGSIGSWIIGETSLTKGTLGDNGSICLYPYGTSRTGIFGTTEEKNWMLGIGSSFGVTKDGNLYCRGGDIAGWSITDRALYKAPTNNNSTTYDGVGFSPDGIDSNTNNDTKCVFWAGFNGYESSSYKYDTPILWHGSKNNSNTSWKDKTKFYITREGEVNCKKLIATGGSIANWTLGQVPVKSGSSSSPKGLYYIYKDTSDSKNNFNLGFALNPGYPGDPILWASNNKTPPWQVDSTKDWKTETNFYLTGRGELSCKTAKIGNLIIDTDSSVTLQNNVIGSNYASVPFKVQNTNTIFSSLDFESLVIQNGNSYATYSYDNIKGNGTILVNWSGTSDRLTIGNNNWDLTILKNCEYGDKANNSQYQVKLFESANKKVLIKYNYVLMAIDNGLIVYLDKYSSNGGTDSVINSWKNKGYKYYNFD